MLNNGYESKDCIKIKEIHRNFGEILAFKNFLEEYLAKKKHENDLNFRL